MSSQKYSRQKKQVPTKIHNAVMEIVGAGAVGRNIVMQLSSMGAGNIYVHDFDNIEEHNCASQGWREGDIGSSKVHTLRSDCRRINRDSRVRSFNSRWSPKLTYIPDYVFLAADCMNTRKLVSEFYRKVRYNTVVIDTRMSGPVIHTLAQWNADSRRYYPQTLFSNDDALDSGCTSQTTIYCAATAASYAIQTMINHMKCGNILRHVSINMENGLRFEY